VSRLADTLAQIDEKRERGEDLGRIPRLEERATPRRAWRIVGTLVIVGSMGVLSLGVWLQPHVPAGPAMTPATIAAAMPVTAPAVTSRDRAASLIQDGLNAVRDGQIQAAAAAFREASDLAPDDALAWTNLGVVLIREGDEARGVESLRRGLRVAPDYPEAHRNLAVVLDRQGHTAETVSHYRAYLAHSADDAPGWTTVTARLTEIEARRSTR